MGKMSLTSCRALSTPGKFSNVDRYGSTKEKLMTLTQSIFAWALEREIHLSASHIPGVINESADRESRKKNKDCEWMLNGGVFSSLCKTFGKPSMDIFISYCRNISDRPNVFLSF